MTLKNTCIRINIIIYATGNSTRWEYFSELLEGSTAESGERFGGGAATQQRYMPVVGAKVQCIGVASAGHGVGAERGGVNERAAVGERCEIVLFAVV